MRPAGVWLLLTISGCAGSPGGAAPDAKPASRFGLDQRPPNGTCKPPAAVNAPARLLSQSGCVDPGDARRPAPGLIPYDVASPLWSDGASKERFLALPDGARLSVGEEGHWKLPVGTVLVKTFSLAGRRIETRLLVRASEFTWKGYSYEWNEAQTDATVLEDVVGGLKKEVAGPGGKQLWHFPSRAQCLQCHTTAAGVSLGPSTPQLDHDFTYPSGVTSNQVATLVHIGLFDTPPDTASRPLPAPNQVDFSRADSVAAGARAYLQVNCANCHRPGGSFEGIDLRASAPLERTGLCNQPPEKGDLGVAGALRLIPGQPDRSLLLLRMMALLEGRMPQIGTSVVDAEGVKVVRQWIQAIGGCP